MRKVFIWLFVLIVFIPSIVYSQSLKDDPRVKSALSLLELWLDAQRDYEQIPGISIAVVHDQEIIWSKGFGYTDLERKSPTTPSTIYSICSISKLFTSIAIMQLRDKGLLRLDDPVEKHLKRFPIKQTYPNGPPITIQSLLTHSSGLPQEADAVYWSCDFSFPTKEEVIEKLSNQKTLYPADTFHQYSNLGMALLGQVVERISGKSYTDYIKENILNPLGLIDTRPEMPEELRNNRLATGYSALTREGIREKLSFFQADGMTPAAGFSSSVEDLAKFASWQFRLIEKGGMEILKSNTLREMHRVHWVDPDGSNRWGLGFMVWRSRGKTFVGHSGGCPGHRSHLLIQTKDKIATVCMVNACGVNQNKYTQQAYEIIAPAIKEVLNNPDHPKEPDSELLKFTGTYSNAPWGGETAVFIWKGNIAMVSFPTNSPLDRIIKYKHIEGNKFRRIRNDGELAEEVVFETDSDGNVIRMRSNGQYYPKIK